MPCPNLMITDLQQGQDRCWRTHLLYTFKYFSPATLFGIYESTRLPISNFISSILSGGVDSCFGNNNISIGKVERRARAFFVAAANSKYHATTRNPLARLIFLQKSWEGWQVTYIVFLTESISALVCIYCLLSFINNP